ncbi:MAG TPA: ATP-binding protein, partial [Aggregatilineaceae bacterium]|nr:ATP-binding protein [Aggregatilineaceae bacterium]
LIVVTTEAEGRYLAASDAHERVTGYRPDEVIGHSAAEFDPWPSPADRRKTLQLLDERGVVRNLETRFVRRSGEPYTALLSMARVEVGGQPCLVSVVNDITERKQADDALRQYATRLNTLYQINRAILAAASPEAIARAALYQVRQLIPCQEAIIGLIQLERDERILLAADPDRATGGFPDTRFSLDSRWMEQLNGGQPYVVADLSTCADPPPGFQNLLERGLRSMASIPLMVHGVLMGAMDLLAEEPAAFTDDYVAIGREVADQLAIAIENTQLYELVKRHAAELELRVKERTAQLEAANQELRTLGRVKDEFVSNVSHELRTPITNLVIREYLLEQQPDRLDTHLGVIRRETDRLARIIEDLLALSRLDQNRTPFRMALVDLNALIKQFIADRVPFAESRGLVLSANCAPELLQVKGDAGLLEQVLSVLLTNALNYTPAGGRVIVGTRAYQSDDQQWVGFNVSDSGLGIKKEEQDRLFTRFFRGEVGRKSGVSGTGLGLALAKEIVDRHHGRIELESDGDGTGTTFNVWLPAAARSGLSS